MIKTAFDQNHNNYSTKNDKKKTEISQTLERTTNWKMESRTSLTRELQRRMLRWSGDDLLILQADASSCSFYLFYRGKY